MTATLMHDLVRESAERRPLATAVVDATRSLGYAELWDRAGRLASLLRSAGCAAGDRVALLVPKSIEAVIGILGVLRAGGVYVPLDPASPAPRLAKIVARSEPRLVLAAAGGARRAGELVAALPEGSRPLLARLDRAEGEEPLPPLAFGADDLERAAPAGAEPPRRPEDPAHLLFTSGSTGTPKGVMVPHRSVLRFVEWANGELGAAPGDRHSGHSPLFFDLSTFDLFGTLAAGAELHLVPPELSLLPHRLAAFIRDRALTQWFSVPSVLTYLASFDAVRPDDFPALRRLLWCGEVLPTPTLLHWMQRLPHVAFTNLYGPTETTIASSYFTVPAPPVDPAAPIPIGRPCGGEDLLILDEHLRPCERGAEGELCIRGDGLTLGYWRDPETTARAFVDAPGGRMYRTGDRARLGDDGLVYFLGRADQQVKSRGYRIELGEIEAALAALPELREAAAVALDSGGFEGKRIACAYVLRQAGSCTATEIRARLARDLPSYMLPSDWREVATLPRTGNGKVDRGQARALFQRGEA
jgi:amino acid adenylation domain-containing protein